MNLVLLVVDDDKDFREMLAEYFSDRDLKVLQACNGVEALEVLRNNKIDIVFSDVQMPKMNGVDLLKTIRKEFVDSPPVYIMSGWAPITSESFLAPGASGYFDKPLDMEKVMDVFLKCNLNRVPQIRPA